MAAPSSPLPEFTRPPLVEAALTVQFEKIEKLRTVEAGLFWDRLRNEFPDLDSVEEHPPIEQRIEVDGAERFRSAGVQVELVGTPTLPRLFFVTDSKNELIQLQSDRISHNWRKRTENDEYVRYEQKIRPRFLRELRLLDQFLADEKLGALTPVQCEIAYINHIEPLGGLAKAVSASDVLRVLSSSYQGVAGCELEDVNLNLQHVIRDSGGNFMGRLLVSTKSALRRADNRQILVLELVARGKPIGEGIEGALRFLDHGRRLLRECFDSISTERMHEIWGRTDGR